MKRHSLWQRFKHWKDQPLSFEQWEQAYLKGRYDEALEWREIVQRANLQVLQMQMTGPQVVIASKQQVTQPLSVRQIAGVANLKRSLPDMNTVSTRKITLEDIANYQNTFRNVKN